MGFKLGMNIGGPWIKRVTPKNETMLTDFKALMELDFDSLAAAHGSHQESGAKSLIQDEISKIFSQDLPLQTSVSGQYIQKSQRLNNRPGLILKMLVSA